MLLLNTVGAPANNDVSPQPSAPAIAPTSAPSAAPYQFSYDVRVRNTPMETSRKAAREALLATVQQLEAVVPRVQADATMQLDAITPYMQSFPTSFGRELWFCALHAVHHWSMVRVIAGEMVSARVKWGRDTWRRCGTRGEMWDGKGTRPRG